VSCIRAGGTISYKYIPKRTLIQEDPSASGKTIIIASTEGNVAIPDHEEAKIGLNVYLKKK
jgi:hypothetical protein